MNDTISRILIVVCGILLFFGMVSCGQHFDKERTRKLQRIQTERCYVSSYYGVSGGYKTYTCLTGIYKESEL